MSDAGAFEVAAPGPEAPEMEAIEEDETHPSGPGVAPEPYEVLEFVTVEIVLPSTHPVLRLREAAEPHRELRIPIGVPEGVAIAYAARGMPTPRPLTHELFVQVIESLGATIETVRITAVEGASYAAELVLSGPSGMRVLPCRPSDGVCLALRQRNAVPLTASGAVLDQAGYDSVPD